MIAMLYLVALCGLVLFAISCVAMVFQIRIMHRMLDDKPRVISQFRRNQSVRSTRSLSLSSGHEPECYGHKQP